MIIDQRASVWIILMLGLHILRLDVIPLDFSCDPLRFRRLRGNTDSMVSLIYRIIEIEHSQHTYTPTCFTQKHPTYFHPEIQSFNLGA